MTTRVLLVDDHKIIRDGLRKLLEEQSGYEVVGEAADGREGVRLALELRPDIVVMDIAMKGLNGVEATQKILSEAPRIQVIALSMHSDAPYVSRMLKAGARGYLLKDCAFEELTTALQQVAERRLYLSPQVTGVVVDDYVRKMDTDDGAEPRPELTPKEREVLQLLAEGQSTKEMASTLSVSVKTIETHRGNIMNKLELRSIAELTKFAIRSGLTSLGD
ncbi:MAG: response regulator transcription factor [Planctomycetota bacterium]